MYKSSCHTSYSRHLFCINFKIIGDVSDSRYKSIENNTSLLPKIKYRYFIRKIVLKILIIFNVLIRILSNNGRNKTAL